MHVLPEVPEWIPVRLDGLAAGGVGAFRCAEEELIYREDVEARARRYELQAIRWPDPFPADTEWALLAATYAKQIGRGVAFSLAAFRQAFAGGRDLGERDNILIAAAACEMHPAAVLKAIDTRLVRDELARRTAEAASAGVRDVPAVRVGDAVFHGDAALPGAARAAAA
jgi:2-hydroxychromene-2-carboxylate isomerase